MDFKTLWAAFSNSEFSNHHISHLVEGHYGDLRRTTGPPVCDRSAGARRQSLAEDAGLRSALSLLPVPQHLLAREGFQRFIIKKKRCCYLNGYKTGEPSLPLRYWDSASSLQPAWFRNGQVIIEFWHICICSGLVNGWGPMWLTGLVWIHLEFQQSLHLTHGWKWFFHIFSTSATKFFDPPVFGHLVDYEPKFTYFGWKMW